MKTTTLKKSTVLRNTIHLMLPLFLLVSCSNQSDLPTADEAKSAVMEKITIAADKWSQGDPMGYFDYAADDIVWTDEIQAKKPIIGADVLKSYLEPFKGEIPVHKAEISETIFQVYDDIVIVSYQFQSIFEDGPTDPWKITGVFRYIDGDWKSVHENWTLVEQ